MKMRAHPKFVGLAIKHVQSICRVWQLNGGTEVLRGKLGRCSPSHYLTWCTA